MDDDHTSPDRGVAKGPWGAPRIAPPPHLPLAAPGPVKDVSRAARRRIGLSAILFAVLMVALVGGRAYKDLSRPEAWAYWRDAYLSPSLKSSVADVEIDGRKRVTLAVSGKIGAAAATWFRTALDDAKLSAGDVVALSSPGGNLDQALVIGEMIRARGLATAVGTIDSLGRLTPSYCASACVFVFAGGKPRFGLDGSKLGVHRFTTKASGSDAVADAQRTTGFILGYMTRMGVSPSILELMTATGEIRWLNEAQATDLELVTEPLPRS